MIYTIRLDTQSETVMYLGKAAPGSMESEAVWQIQKIDTNSTLLQITYPDGVINFNYRWTDRLALTYI